MFVKTAKFFLTAFVLFIGASSLISESWAISWETDLDAALQRSSAEGKPVMADFYTEWCHWCKKLDEDVYTDANVNSIAENFICVKVNCEIDKGAFKKYGLRGYPTIIFFNTSGEAGETVVGYRTAKVFADTMSKFLGQAEGAAAGRPSRTDKTQPSAELQPAPAARPDPESAVKKKMAAGQFDVEGIMGSRAIVNGKVVAVGDRVNGAQVIAITGKSVKLLYKGRELVVYMQI